jgi:hypothetical protein
MLVDGFDGGVQLSLAPAKNENVSAFGYEFFGGG